MIKPEFLANVICPTLLKGGVGNTAEGRYTRCTEVMVPIDIIEIAAPKDLLQTAIAINRDEPTLIILSNKHGEQQMVTIKK